MSIQNKGDLQSKLNLNIFFFNFIENNKKITLIYRSIYQNIIFLIIANFAYSYRTVFFFFTIVIIL
jgi:hypothetical protein